MKPSFRKETSSSSTTATMMTNVGNDNTIMMNNNNTPYPSPNELIHAIINGNICKGFPEPPSKLVKLFISSTRTDFEIERQHLHEIVLPKLERYCNSLSLDLLAIDPHWQLQPPPPYTSLVPDDDDIEGPTPDDDEEDEDCCEDSALNSSTSVFDFDKSNIEPININNIEIIRTRSKQSKIRISFMILFKSCFCRGPMMMRILSALFFAISSFLLVVINKIILTTYQ